MVSWKCFCRCVGLTGVSFVALGVSSLVAQEKPEVKRADPSKVVEIEKSVKAVVRTSSGPNPAQPPAAAGAIPKGPRFDTPKMAAIEVSALAAVRGSSTGATAKPSAEFVNPKVQPGKVPWHDSFAAACAASAKSGKPVLLFQMMGKLDDQFC